MASKLPIGVQSFEKLRIGNYTYVDKTSYVFHLAQSGVPIFLSRPRRFGKSLLVSTFCAYFEGRRDLFEGLDIERLEANVPDPWQVRPVFLFSFNGVDYTRKDALDKKLDALLRDLEAMWGDEWADLPPGPRFQHLIELAHRKSGRRVAVLVDEYDKPLLDTIDDPDAESRNRAALKGFFSVLKDADAHLRFAFITGVSRFSKVSIFSDLNQLRDISLVRDCAGICGITQDEVDTVLADEVATLAHKLGTGYDECKAELARAYDGYRFHPAGPGVYNPFSLLNAFANGELGPYWFSSGTPTFLVQRMHRANMDPRRLTDKSIYVSGARLSDYTADDPDPIPLMYQAGYLTIQAYDARRRRYTLGVPNDEVGYGLFESLLPAYAPSAREGSGTDVYTLDELLEAGDTDGIRNLISALFASIPYTREDDPFENYFQAVLWLTFTLIGRFVQCEVHTATGRIDCIVQTDAHIYLFEFKRDGTASDALAQIEQKGYAIPFANDSRELHCIGCAFDSKTRRLSDWEEA